MLHEFSRTALLLGEDAVERLGQCSVAVFGVGGVGSYAAEALARSGIGALSLFDADTVNLTNINRQLAALHSTLGRYKAEVMRDRILDIHPRCRATAHICFYAADNADLYDLSSFDYIVDAIDTVTSKLLLVERAFAAGVPVISSMGAGNKLDPTRFEVADIYKTSVCPLARVMRRELKARGVPCLKVVYSREEPVAPSPACDAEPLPGSRRQLPGSVAFVPSAAGLILASEVVRDLAAHKV